TSSRTAAMYTLSLHDALPIWSGELANRRTGGRVKVLMPVHLFGQMADMNGLVEIAARNGLKVVEDAAQAIGAEDEAGHRAGSVRSEEHTSELQSRGHLVCRLL